MSTPGYPDGYQDPPHDGTAEDFGEKVIPARTEALTESLNEHFAGLLPDGMRFGWEPPGEDAPPPPGAPELLLPRKESVTFLVPPALLADYAGMGDLLGKALRGEIELKPPPEPERHRCLACWLVSLLPGHDRCEHGRLTGCGECEDWR